MSKKAIIGTFFKTQKAAEKYALKRAKQSGKGYMTLNQPGGGWIVVGIAQIAEVKDA